MTSENEKDGESVDNLDEESDASSSLTKDEAKKFYGEKGIDLSPDVPVHPKPIPDFEKSLR